ncbi:MAG: S24/S26 family peptidase, partial [Acidobacteria bacterium]|nr:S24/S26 family peptidase [Acidobacteriota bacterium]
MDKIHFIPFLSQTPTKLKVSGFSMTPSIEENDQIFVVSATKENIKVGDIVVFRREGRDYVHRVVLIDNENFYEIGDNQGVGNWESF